MQAQGVQRRVNPPVKALTTEYTRYRMTGQNELTNHNLRKKVTIPNMTQRNHSHQVSMNSSARSVLEYPGFRQFKLPLTNDEKKQSRS